MKFFIVGLHSSGKQEVVDCLNKFGVKCGKLFSNITEPSPYNYNSYNYELYSDKDIVDVFENNAYLFIQEINQNSINFNPQRFYEGLSKYTFDQNDVFILGPNQILEINPKSINEEICFVWLDNTLVNRTCRYNYERRLYNFQEQDKYERRDIGAFVKTLYSFNNSRMLYFTNEEPNRVATIIYTLIKHPDMIDTYITNFNN